MSSATERGYTTGIAIFLAYSGMEALAGAMGEPVRTWQLEDPTLARSLNRLLSGVDLSHPKPKEGIGWLLDGHQLLGNYKSFRPARVRMSSWSCKAFDTWWRMVHYSPPMTCNCSRNANAMLLCNCDSASISCVMNTCTNGWIKPKDVEHLCGAD